MGPAQIQLNSVNRYSGKRNLPGNDNKDGDSFERRRIGQIVHDDRGSATLKWHDAPLDDQRQKLELEDTHGSGRGDSKLRGGLTLEEHKVETFNPYDRGPDSLPGGRGRSTGAPKGGKRDLRKLSDWLKM